MTRECAHVDTELLSLRELARRTGVKFIVPENPMHCVILGTADILANLAKREHLLIKP